MDAKQYLEHWKKGQIWTHLEWPKHQQRFKDIAALCVGNTAIDIGCAFGHSTDYLNKFFPAKWAGMDFVQEATAQASLLFPQYEFIFAGNYDLFYWTGYRTFDTVICSEVIEHVAEDEKFMAGLMNITARRLILTTPNKKVNDPGHLRVYTFESLASLIRPFGHSFAVKEFGPFYFPIIDKAEKDDPKTY